MMSGHLIDAPVLGDNGSHSGSGVVRLSIEKSLSIGGPGSHLSFEDVDHSDRNTGPLRDVLLPMSDS